MLTLVGHTAAVRCVAYSPDGALLASGGDDGAVRVWNLGSRVTVWASKNSAFYSVEAVAFTLDSALVLAGLSNGKLIAFATRDSRRTWEKDAHEISVKAILPHPDGSRVYTAGLDRDIWVWRLSKPKRVNFCSLPGLPAAVALSAVALSPDGNTLAIGMANKGTVRLMDTRSGQDSTVGTGDNGAVVALAFSGDGSLLAAGHLRGRVTIRAALERRVQPTRSLDGHTLPVYGLAFTPDGRRLVSAGADKTARVWDVATGRSLHEFLWHQSWVTCLAMSPDGLTVATGGEDKSIAVWDVPE
jgi:WD40 repeat protein